ncbi:MAG: hypothetical protein AB8H03_14475 [Saprospiraceae bacterium]
MKKKNSLESMKKRLSLKKKSISIFDKKMHKNTKGGIATDPISPIILTKTWDRICPEG